METRLKYAWDITTQRDFSARELEAVEEVSRMLSAGCKVKELNGKLKMLK